MGGYVALWLAYQKPLRVGKIVTLGTKFDWSPESAEKEVRKLNVEKIQEEVPAFARILEHRHSPVDWKILLKKTGEMMTRLGEEPLLTTEILRKISNPVSIALGDMDDMADRNYSEQVASLLPHCKFILLRDTPHPIEKVKLDHLLNLLQN
jgi:pimeloyl-ACP methyl ester carboxylesterase